VNWNVLTNFLVEPFSFTIAYVDPNIAGQKEGENNTQQFSWHLMGDNEQILPIVKSIVNTMILSIVNAAIAGLPYPSWKIREVWGCWEEPNGDGGLHACNVTLIFDNNFSGRWVKVAMKFNIPGLFCVVYRGQHADGPDGTLTAWLGGHSYFRLDDILLPVAKDMIHHLGEESNDTAEMWH